MKQPSKLFAVLIAASVAVMAGCGTVTPPVAKASAPSWDGAAQNSGVIAILPDSSLLVTEYFADRYAALVARFGSRLTPPLTNTVGLAVTSSNTLTLTPQGFSYFAAMNRWNKQK